MEEKFTDVPVPEPYTCQHCGARHYPRPRYLTKGLVKLLLKMYSFVIETNGNKFNRTEIDSYSTAGLNKKYSYVENESWSHLRYHGLIARYFENGKRVLSTWCITRKAGHLLHGGFVSRYIVSMNKHTVARSLKQTTLKEIMKKDADYWQRDFNIELARLDENIPDQGILFPELDDVEIKEFEDEDT